MTKTIKYPVGIQDFEKLRSMGFVYVDKTMYIKKLADSPTHYFLGRPRRFGKSLLLSTIHAYFEGKKDLFEGLAISKLEERWEQYPVIHIDFTGRNYSDSDSLVSKLSSTFEELEKKYNCPLPEKSVDERFEKIIRNAYEETGKKVVILIDEYDKPLLDTFKQPELQDKFRNILRGVYGNLKGMDAYIQFAMLTGVTRFGKLSIFSDTNNLKDISMMQEYSGICGITTEELHTYFEEGVRRLAAERNCTTGEAYEILKTNYDGYHFTEKCTPDIYNPFSLLNALQNLTIDDYWFETGTPRHLIDLINDKRINLQDLENREEPKSTVKNVAFNLDTSLIPVLYQSGYLTIKGYDDETDMLRLGYPNEEVRKGFLLYLMDGYFPKGDRKSWTDIVAFYRDIKSGNVDSFMRRLQRMYADFNSEGFNFINLEQHYQDVAYLVFRLLGCIASVEYRSAKGRIDMVIKMPDYIYIFEFKRNSSAQTALEQIDSKNYMIPFQSDGRKVIKIGANFSDEIKGLQNWIFE